MCLHYFESIVQVLSIKIQDSAFYLLLFFFKSDLSFLFTEAKHSDFSFSEIMSCWPRCMVYAAAMVKTQLYAHMFMTQFTMLM